MSHTGYKKGDPLPSTPWALTKGITTPPAPCSEIEGYHAWRDPAGPCECGEHEWPVAEDVAQ